MLIHGFDRYQARRGLGAIQGIHRVDKQINNHLLQLHRVPQNGRQTGIQIQLDAGISGHRITLDQLDRIPCQAVEDADGNPATTEDQHTKPDVEVDNSTGSIAMMGGRLIGNTTTGLSGKVLLGYVDFVAVANGRSDLVVDRFAYHPEQPTKTFDNFVKLNGSVDEPKNLRGTLGSIYIVDDACECNLNSDARCSLPDYNLFLQYWGRQNCPL